MIQTDLAAFLQSFTAPVAETAHWADGQITLRIHSYLSTALPPLDTITSVRCILFRADAILVSRNTHRTHIVPGGRREPGEALEQTLHREVLEETGWTCTDASLLGFIHFHHLSPKQPDDAYPYPDFMQVIYMAQAVSFHPDAKLTDDYEHASEFCPIDEVRALNLTPSERLYLDAVLHRRNLPM